MPETENRRRSPEKLLEQVEAEERSKKRGKLKIFLGYASGAGKSQRMFDEGGRRKQRGQDVVVGAEQNAPLDLDALLARRPQVVLIDGLAFRNPAGSRNPQRWQDVEELLDAGISVITSINLHYVKERQAQVEAIRGTRVSDSTPESFIRGADEIELVDAPAEYCLTRGGDDLDEAKLSALREISLLLAADVVDRQLEAYLHRHGIEQHYGTHERILICVTPRSNAALMIRRGERQAKRFHGELFVVYVQQDGLSQADQRMLDENLARAREAEAHVDVLHGEDAIDAILKFARAYGITQLFVGHSAPTGWLSRLRLSPVERLILEAGTMDVRIFPQQGLPDGA
jgi:two-component system sensor histidine kinase KdpD